MCLVLPTVEETRAHAGSPDGALSNVRPASLLGPVRFQPAEHHARRKTCFVPPDETLRKKELKLADGRVDTLAVGHLEHISS